MTSEQVEDLRRRVQDRASLYTVDGMDPLKVESLLDEVNLALRELGIILFTRGIRS
jgi:hypothetical protein